MDENIFPRPLKFESFAFPLLNSYFCDELIKSIDLAKQTILSIQYQWKWNIHERHSKVQRLGASIIRAKNRNVKVKIILNTESPLRNLSKINSVTNDQLTRAGCEVRLIRTVSILHTKLWIFDTSETFIGSHNVSSRSLSSNEEVSVKIESREFALYMSRYFDNLWSSR